jgi:hypothetical protein
MSTSRIIWKASSFLFDIATSSIKSDFSISSTRNALKKHFELRYRFDFLDLLNLLMMNCMQSVIDFNQTLKSRSYKKIMKNFSRDKWIMIMKNENNFLLINKTWILTIVFRNKRVLRDKWVYKIKKNERDEILRYKTRWIVRDFEQIENLNYTKTFILMIKSISYKTMYVIIVVNDWEIKQMNVKIAFLYKKIEKNVYVMQSIDFEQNVNQICKLNKTMYDLKQFSRVWFEVLMKFFFFITLYSTQKTTYS